MGLYLLVAFLWLAGFGLTTSNNFCTIVLQGTRTKYEVPLETILLNKGIRDWKVDIPHTTWKCPEKQHQVGSQIKVCDIDNKPDVSFEVKNGAFVHRTGSLEGEATLDVVAFCTLHYTAVNDHIMIRPSQTVVAQPLDYPIGHTRRL